MATYTSRGFHSVSAWMLKYNVMNPFRGFLPRDIRVNFNSAPAMGTRRRGWNIHPKKSSLLEVLCVQDYFNYRNKLRWNEWALYGRICEWHIEGHSAESTWGEYCWLCTFKTWVLNKTVVAYNRPFKLQSLFFFALASGEWSLHIIIG